MFSSVCAPIGRRIPVVPPFEILLAVGQCSSKMCLPGKKSGSCLSSSINFGKKMSSPGVLYFLRNCKQNRRGLNFSCSFSLFLGITMSSPGFRSRHRILKFFKKSKNCVSKFGSQDYKSQSSHLGNSNFTSNIIGVTRSSPASCESNEYESQMMTSSIHVLSYDLHRFIWIVMPNIIFPYCLIHWHSNFQFFLISNMGSKDPPSEKNDQGIMKLSDPKSPRCPQCGDCTIPDIVNNLRTCSNKVDNCRGSKVLSESGTIGISQSPQFLTQSEESGVTMSPPETNTTTEIESITAATSLLTTSGDLFETCKKRALKMINDPDCDSETKDVFRKKLEEAEATRLIELSRREKVRKFESELIMPSEGKRRRLSSPTKGITDHMMDFPSKLLGGRTIRSIGRDLAEFEKADRKIGMTMSSPVDNSH